MFQFVKPRESVELMDNTKPVGVMESLFYGMIISINILKIKSIVPALIVILKLAIRVPRDIEAEITILLFTIEHLICGKWLLWMRICGRRVISLPSINVIGIHNGTTKTAAATTSILLA